MSEKRVRFVPAFTLLDQAKRKLSAFKYRVLIMSGKGGVGKSLISSLIAMGLALKGRSVSLLDADIHGSSIPVIMGLRDKRHFANENGEILPVETSSGVKVVAVGLMTDTLDTPVIWRGPLLGRAVIELAAKVSWSRDDYLIVDMPPGTGDVAITIAQVFPKETLAILVTSPSTLSEVVVARAANFAKSTGIRLIGVVENMSYFKCPHCGHITNIMGRTAGDKLAERYGLKVIGRIPLDPLINEAVEKGNIEELFRSNTNEIHDAVEDLINRFISIVENQDNKGIQE